jgi:hypothetical protein
MRPGWEKEDSFIKLYLALNLPVVVRWINGSTVTMDPIWEESLGAHIEYKIEVKTAKIPGYIEPDVEFEIYRPEVPQPMSSKSECLDFSVILHLKG